MRHNTSGDTTRAPSSGDEQRHDMSGDTTQAATKHRRRHDTSGDTSSDTSGDTGGDKSGACGCIDHDALKKARF